MVTSRFCINFANSLPSVDSLLGFVPRPTRFIEYLEIWIFHACVCRGARARPANTFQEHGNLSIGESTLHYDAKEFFWCSTRHAPRGIRGLRRWCRQNPTDFKCLFWTFLRTLLDSYGLKKRHPSPGARSDDCILYCIFQQWCQGIRKFRMVSKVPMSSM